MKPHHQILRAATCMPVLVAAIVACDKDPSRPDVSPLNASVVLSAPGDSTIGRQQSIRVVFNDSVDQRTALDRENFIVVDSCTGLRVAGSLRLSGDTLSFTPERALPFLTPLQVRVQNVLGVNARALRAPFTFSLRTEAPPVSDVSWQALDTPTNDDVLGIDFLDRNVGYLSTNGGAIYRTRNGGQSFEALFKDPDLIVTRGIRTAGVDTLYMTAAPSFGGTTYTTAGLYRSVDGGRSFQPVFLSDPASMSGPSLYKAAGRKPVALIAGYTSGLQVWRYDANNDSVATFTTNGDEYGFGAVISANGTSAAAVGDSAALPGQFGSAVLYRSTTGGRTFQKIPLTGGPNSALLGVAFSGGTQGVAVGARSAVYRFDAATGTVTREGSASGIPQTDSTANRLVFYTFFAVSFAPGSTTGWIVGEVRTRIVGQPDVARGIIMQTTDGGLNWTRQAVRGEREDGLGFDPLYDVSALGQDFSAAGGASGFLASRTAASSAQTGVCSFENQQATPLQP